MDKKWMPITAGIINIIIGIATIFTGLLLSLGGAGLGGGDLRPELTTTGALVITIGVLAILGGVFALIRKIWPLALIGAVAVLLGSIPWLYDFWRWVDSPGDLMDINILFGFTIAPGIAAIILVVKSRQQF